MRTNQINCANKYAVAQIKGGRYRIIRRYCNRNDCPACAERHRKETMDAIIEAVDTHKLGYMLTISPPNIKTNNSSDGYKEYCKQISDFFTSLSKLNYNTFCATRNRYPSNNQANNLKRYNKYVSDLRSQLLLYFFSKSRYKKEGYEEFAAKHPIAQKRMCEKVEKIIKRLQESQFLYIRVAELSSLRKLTKSGLPLHFHILCNSDVADIANMFIPGSSVASGIYDVETLAKYMTKTFNYATYSMWENLFGRVQKRITSSQIGGKPIVSIAQKKEGKRKEKYKIVSTFSYHGVMPKSVFTDRAQLDMAINQCILNDDTEHDFTMLKEKYQKELRENIKKEYISGNMHNVDALIEKCAEKLQREADQSIYLHAFLKLIEPMVKQNFLNNFDALSAKSKPILNKRQQEAINMFGEGDKLMVLTGVAGTGKSYVVSSLPQFYDFSGKKIIVTSLSQIICDQLAGKLKKSLDDIGVSASVSAENVCRLLRCADDDTFSPLKPCRETYIDADLLIIEEASLLSFQMLYKLLSYVPKECKILILGDPYQLGNYHSQYTVFDIFSRIKFNAEVELTTVKRQSSGGAVLDLSTQIRKGVDYRKGLLKISEQLSYDRIKELHSQGYTFLCATNEERKNIERMISDGYRLKKGAEIMITRNYRRYGITNGMFCTVSKLTDSTVILARPGGSKVTIPLSDRRFKYASADVMTVHKSQGNEFDKVALIILDSKSLDIIDQRMLYTAVTRAKKEIKILINSQDIRSAMALLSQDKRTTDFALLKKAIRENIPSLALS